jgi:hypothetical protein
MKMVLFKGDLVKNKKELLQKKISNLEKSLLILSFVQGINFSFNLTVYFLYFRIFKISLPTFAIMELIFLLTSYFRPLLGLLFDNVHILGSNRKSYLIIIYILKCIFYIIIIIFMEKENTVEIIFVSNYIIQILYIAKEVILVSLTIKLKSLYQLQNKKITVTSSEKSLAWHYASKFIGRLVAFILIYYLETNSSLKSNVCLFTK